jgi:hypothetical protein
MFLSITFTKVLNMNVMMIISLMNFLIKSTFETRFGFFFLDIIFKGTFDDIFIVFDLFIR